MFETESHIVQGGLELPDPFTSDLSMHLNLKCRNLSCLPIVVSPSAPSSTGLTSSYRTGTLHTMNRNFPFPPPTPDNSILLPASELTSLGK